MVSFGNVAHIPFHQGNRVGSSQLFDSVERFRRAVVEVVEHHQLIPLFKQNQTGVTSDEACTAGDQDSSAHGSIRLDFRILNQLGCKSLTAQEIEPSVQLSLWACG